jgi:hypothetical protein
LGYDKLSDLIYIFQDKSSIVQNKINSIDVSQTERYVESNLGLPIASRVLSPTTTEKLYLIRENGESYAMVKLVYKEPDQTVKAVIIKNLCDCFYLNSLGSAYPEIDFREKLFLNSYDTHLNPYIKNLEGNLGYEKRVYHVKGATAPSTIYEEYYEGRPGRYYSLVLGYHEDDLPYEDAYKDFYENIKDINNP